MTDIERLEAYIAAFEMTRAQVAEFVGVPERTLYRWLSGERRVNPLALRILDDEFKRRFPKG
jgi:DNA-binding transcriptional regulator YiaG